MSYLSDFQELNGGYVAFGGNPKGGKISEKGKIKTGFQGEFDAEKEGEEANQQYMIFPVWSTGSPNPQNKEGDAAFDEKEHGAEKPESAVNFSPSSSALSGEQDDMTKKKDKGKSPIEYFTKNKDLNADFEDYSEDSSNDVSAAGPIVPTAGQNYSNSTNPFSADGPSNTNTSPTHGKPSLNIASQHSDNSDMLKIEDIAYSDHENVGAEADFNNLETSITFSHIPTTRTYKAHPISQIICDLSSTTQTRSMTRVIKDQGLQVKQKKDGIFISQDKYVAKILKKFELTEEKSASTPIDTKKPLLKDPDGEDVDVHIYRLISWQCKKQTVVATSSTEAEYVSKDATRLQALVDRKKVVVTEAAIRDVLRLDDAKGVDCLPNEEIFTELARMGYEKPSAMASAVICLSTGHKFNLSKYIFDSLVRNVDSSLKFYMYPRKVGKGCFGVKTPLFEGMLVAREPKEQGDAQKQGTDDNAADEPDTVVTEDDVAQDLKIIKLKTRVKKLEKDNKVKALKLRRLRKVGTSQRVDTLDDTIMEDVSNQGRMIDELDRDKGAVDIYQIDMDHAAKVLSMQEDEPEVQEVVEVVTTAKLITKVVDAVCEIVSAAATETAARVKVAIPFTRRRRGVIIKDPEEESSAQTPTETKSKDKGKGMSYDDIHPIFKAKFNANMEFLLKLKEQIEEETNRALESINETPAQKAAKRRKRNEEVKDVEEIKQHLEIVPDEDDDVYIEATPLARKVPIMDYQIIHFNNKPHYKIIHADGTHQLATRKKLMLLDNAAGMFNAAKLNTKCIILSSDFKLPDDNHVLLRVPRKNNMYNVDLKNIVPLGDLTCLFAKLTLDESNLWRRRLGHINFKTMNKLVKGNLVRGLPLKVFENNHTCVAYKKRKQHRASCKTKPVRSVSQPLQRVLVTKPHNKTPYELSLGRTPSVGFMRPFGCHVTTLNTLDPLDPHNSDADATFEVKEPEFKVHVSPSMSAKTKKNDDKTKREAKGKSHVELSIGVRNLSEEFEDFSSNSTNGVNAASTPVTAVEPNSTNSTTLLLLLDTVVATSSTEAEYVAAVSCLPSVGNKMHKAFPLPVTEFPLPEEVPTASEESSHCQKKRDATVVKIALLLKSRRNYQSDDSYAKLIINDVSLTLMLFGLTIDNVHLMLLGHKTNDVMMLQALIDRRKVIITEDTVRQALRLDEADSIYCLTNKEIFAELARMGVGNGFSEVDTLLFDGMSVPQQVDDVAAATEDEDAANEISVDPTPPSPPPATTPPP
nr:putative ribonuclease H-like domain-containing protein [Tanacetum cinerariifolium]